MRFKVEYSMYAEARLHPTILAQKREEDERTEAKIKFAAIIRSYVGQGTQRTMLRIPELAERAYHVYRQSSAYTLDGFADRLRGFMDASESGEHFPHKRIFVPIAWINQMECFVRFVQTLVDMASLGQEEANYWLRLVGTVCIQSLRIDLTAQLKGRGVPVVRKLRSTKATRRTAH
jgi:hypothetical protein